MSKTYIATFDNVPQANRAVSALFAEGFTQREISMMVSDTTHKEHLAIEPHTKAPEGAAIGTAAGGAIGAVVAGLTAVAGIVIPGIGFSVAGPLVAALAGLRAGPLVDRAVVAVAVRQAHAAEVARDVDAALGG